MASPINTTADIEDLKAQLATLKTDMADLGKILSDLPKEKIAEARIAAKVNAEKARETALDYVAQAESAARRNPGAALGIAAGAGFLAGLLMGGRR